MVGHLLRAPVLGSVCRAVGCRGACGTTWPDRRAIRIATMGESAAQPIRSWIAHMRTQVFRCEEAPTPGRLRVLIGLVVAPPHVALSLSILFGSGGPSSERQILALAYVYAIISLTAVAGARQSGMRRAISGFVTVRNAA